MTRREDSPTLLSRNLIAVVLLSLALTACGLFKREAPSSTTQQQSTNVTVNVGQPSPAPSSSPTAGGASGTCIAADHDRAGFYGFQCDPGISAPHNGDGVLPIGCTGAATVTPKNADGSDQPFEQYSSAVPKWDAVEGHDFLVLVSPAAKLGYQRLASDGWYAAVRASGDFVHRMDEANPFNATLRWAASTPVGTKAHIVVTVCGKTGEFEFTAR